MSKFLWACVALLTLFVTGKWFLMNFVGGKFTLIVLQPDIQLLTCFDVYQAEISPQTADKDCLALVLKLFSSHDKILLE